MTNRLPTLSARPHRRFLRAGLLPGLVASAAASYAVGVLIVQDLAFALTALAGFALLATLTVRGAVRHHPHTRFGAANQITLARGTGTALLAGLIAAPGVLHLHALAVWIPFAAAAALLFLDLCDGALARRQGLVSRFGARFDQEVDAAAILVLSALAVLLADAPVWTLGIGALRYLYLLGGVLYAPLAQPLPYSLSRRVVCGIQIAALGILLAPPVPGAWVPAVAGTALAALAVSFLRDGAWCWRRAQARPAAPQHAGA